MINAVPFTERSASVFTPTPPNVSPNGWSELTPVITFMLFAVVVPVKVRLSRGAFKLRAVVVA